VESHCGMLCLEPYNTYCKNENPQKNGTTNMKTKQNFTYLLLRTRSQRRDSSEPPPSRQRHYLTTTKRNAPQVVGSCA